MTSRARPLDMTSEQRRALLEEARAYLRTAVLLEAWAHEHGIALSDSSDPWLPLPAFGPRTVGPWARCAVCAITGGVIVTYRAMVRTIREHTKHFEIPVAVPGGTFACYDGVALCLEHARDLAKATPDAQTAFREYCGTKTEALA